MNGEEVKNKILGNMKQRGAAAGWLPCSTIRTYEQYLQQVVNQGIMLSCLLANKYD